MRTFNDVRHAWNVSMICFCSPDFILFFSDRKLMRYFTKFKRTPRACSFFMAVFAPLFSSWKYISLLCFHHWADEDKNQQKMCNKMYGGSRTYSHAIECSDKCLNLNHMDKRLYRIDEQTHTHSLSKDSNIRYQTTTTKKKYILTVPAHTPFVRVSKKENCVKRNVNRLITWLWLWEK